MLLEEYGVELYNIPGEKNIVADALSRLPTGKETEMSQLVSLLSRLPTKEFFQFTEANDFPLNYSVIANKQRADDHLQEALKSLKPTYILQKWDDISLYVHHKSFNLYIPASLQFSVLQWYHTTL